MSDNENFSCISNLSIGSDRIKIRIRLDKNSDQIGSDRIKIQINVSALKLVTVTLADMSTADIVTLKVDFVRQNDRLRSRNRHFCFVN